ncbi:MAG: phosphatidate cytidylyltransferase [Parachlamydiales bacterium]|nr:phosphatidate cytidylyltransferase [Parachlamydiales bacterium]
MMNKFSDLKNRLYFAVIAVFFVALVVAFLDNFWDRIILCIVLGWLSYKSCGELITIAQKKGIDIHSRIVPVGACVIIAGFFLSSEFFSFSLLPLFFLFILVMIIFLFDFRAIEGAIVRVSTSLFAILYVAFPLGLIMFFRNDFWGFSNGQFWLIYLLIVTKGTDIFAYFGGKILGKHKLALQLSPKKTMEGFCMGLLGSLGLSLLFLWSGKLLWSDAIVLGIIIGVLGQIGDLAESLLKRDAALKDSSTIPGQGGFLDMVDSLLFTVPLLYFYLML